MVIVCRKPSRAASGPFFVTHSVSVSAASQSKDKEKRGSGLGISCSNLCLLLIVVLLASISHDLEHAAVRFEAK